MSQQSTTFLQAQITTDPVESLTQSVTNIHMALRTKRWGLAFSGKYLFTDQIIDGFFTEIEKSGFALHALAYFPLHCTVPKKVKWTSIPCPSWGPVGKTKSGGACINSSLFLHIGYRREVINYLLREGEYEEGTGPTYSNRITMPGVEIRLGYAVQFWRLTAEIGYGAFLSFPTVEGRIKLFGDEFYTGLHPFKYFVQAAPDLRIGLNIPLINN